MADVRPLNALRYDLDVVGALGDVVSPPYDVIDAAKRQELLGRSSHNVVEIDLPKPYEATGPDGDGDPYARAAETIAAWRAEGALVEDAEPALWALAQDYTAPDGSTHTRHGILARVKVEDYGAGKIRAHERTLPGPKQDRLDLTRATRLNLSPIFSLTTEDAWPLVAPATEGDPWAEVTDEDGTVHRVWRVANPEVHAAVHERLAGAELLIADGHHRYETARAYRDEIGGEGPHEYTLMALTGLDDPGLTVFPTHRLLSGFAGDPERQQLLGNGLGELFDVAEVDDIDPGGEEGVGVFGLYDSHHKKSFRLRLKDSAALDRALADKTEAYRRLDSAILEALVFEGILGMTKDDIAARRGIEYAKSIPDALGLLEDGSYDVAFILRPTPVDQVREVAGAGEIMPPKSTYFFPKILTGIVFNPVG
ncbi:MAG TPA: DUF1015 domain-containing protein [Solirubrobacterales bacterium]